MDASLLSRIDFLRLAINLGGKPRVIEEILDLFIETSQTLIRELEGALRDGNVVLWLQVLHKLKGGAQNITAKRLAGICTEAEEIRELPHPHAEAVLYHMYKEFAHLRQAIEEYRNQHGRRDALL
jgi:HPt (histidine-containing phosphotransfer) domain-containing protein